MRFAELLSSAKVSDTRRLRGDPDVTGVASDSRCCGEGYCFVAIEGTSDDGHKYIPAAIRAGCQAVVCRAPQLVPNDVACAQAKDTRVAAAMLGQAMHGWPSRKLTCVGVTGTNGKSTVTHLLSAVLAAGGLSPALLGTICYETGLRSEPARTTTPGPIELARMTGEMVASGRTHLVMEVSSHALDQRRTAGVDFRVAVFTNLTGDHLDYHKTMDQYRAAKLRMFEQLAPEATAVVNRDDPAGELVAQAAPGRVVWYGLSPAADVWAKIENIDAAGTRFALTAGDQQVSVVSGLIGRHNVYNCLGAAAAAMELGVNLETVAAAITSMDCVPGRLQRVAGEVPYKVFVDYAHTDDALANVLSSLRPLTGGRIILVFGCGGDRDQSKRQRMAKVGQDLADRLVITSDNPRSEDPQAIIDQIVAGLSDSGRRRAEIEPDRRAAIALAIDMAQEADVVLVAGKGHENYQIIGSQRLPFDDVKVAAELIGAGRVLS